MATSDEGVRYRDKVTIVTGGAQGIGRACVETFGKLLLFLGFHWFDFVLILSLARPETKHIQVCIYFTILLALCMLDRVCIRVISGFCMKYHPFRVIWIPF